MATVKKPKDNRKYRMPIVVVVFKIVQLNS